MYVVWQESADIFVARSADGGQTFPSITDIGNTFNSSIRSLPQIQVDTNGNVYVVWRSGTSIKAAISTDGLNFGSEAVIGSTGGASFDVPLQIATSGTNAYAVWQDNNDGAGDIKFAKSVNGAAFGSETNLSGSAGLSTLPQISASGTNVFVVWEDRTADTSGDILLKKPLSLEGTLNEIFQRMIKNDFEMVINIIKGNYKIQKQNGHSTYYKRRKPEESELNLNKSKQYIYNFIRMLSDPYPNAFIKIEKHKIIFKSTKLENGKLSFEGEIE